MGRLDMSCEGRGQQVIIYLKDNLNSRTFVWILQDLDGKMGGGGRVHIYIFSSFSRMSKLSLWPLRIVICKCFNII